MTIAVRFSLGTDDTVVATVGREPQVVNDLDELRLLLECNSDCDLESAARFGGLSVLFAVKGLLRAGTHPSRSNILRELDAHDFVLADEPRHRAFLQGLEEAMAMARADTANFESAVWKQLR